MTEQAQSVMELAGLTAVVGMGVVFSALVLLSIYMNLFKRIIGKLEAVHKEKRAVSAASASGASSSPVDIEGEQIAAATGVGLYLDGVHGGAGDSVAAAIGVGLHLQGVPGSTGSAAAAAIGVGLHLQGLPATGDAALAAAIGVALELKGGCTAQPAVAPMAGAGPWKVAGWLDTHAAARMIGQSATKRGR